MSKTTESTVDYLSFGIAVLTLFCFQVFAGKAGHSAASLFSYEQIDPWDVYAGISVHHFIQMIIALAAIVAVSWKKNRQINNTLPVYNFPLNTGNILGTLGFQLFLSETSEEIMYRALPITVLSYVFRQRSKLKWNITFEALGVEIICLHDF